ncbi:MAG TPA: hypothetical protein V6D48_18395 [Oculatellaceae cyanobacterium]
MSDCIDVKGAIAYTKCRGMRSLVRVSGNDRTLMIERDSLRDSFASRLCQITLVLRERSHTDDSRVRSLVSDCIDIKGAIA